MAGWMSPCSTPAEADGGLHRPTAWVRSSRPSAHARHPRRRVRSVPASARRAFRCASRKDILEGRCTGNPTRHAMITHGHQSPTRTTEKPGPGFGVTAGKRGMMQRQKQCGAARPGGVGEIFSPPARIQDRNERAARVKCPAMFLIGRSVCDDPDRAGRDLPGAVPNSTVLTLGLRRPQLMGEKRRSPRCVVEFLRGLGAYTSRMMRMHGYRFLTVVTACGPRSEPLPEGIGARRALRGPSTTGSAGGEPTVRGEIYEIPGSRAPHRGSSRAGAGRSRARSMSGRQLAYEEPPRERIRFLRATTSRTITPALRSA